MITTRDWYYIEDRLLAPMAGAMAAHERLSAINGQTPTAARLMRAMQAFQDECCAIRTELRDERNWQTAR